MSLHPLSQQPGGGLVQFTKDVYSKITIEPITFLGFTIYYLTEISAQALYLDKACQVNLSHSAEECSNLISNSTLQVQTQEYVSGVQAHNSFLQAVPALVFTMIAGPLSDTYGRKPLIVLPIFGFIVLNLVFLVNSIWFTELKVEYLLFECLQDFTGGRMMLGLASKLYIMDVTCEETRTARIALVDAAMCLAEIGPPLGAWLRGLWGYSGLFLFSLSSASLTLVYGLFLKDSCELVSQERKEEILTEKKKAQIRCDRDVFRKVGATVLSGVKSFLSKRPQRLFLWTFFLIAVIGHFAGQSMSVMFLFHRLRYKIQPETYGWLMSAFGMGGFFSQLVLVPFLVFKLKVKDTTLIMMAGSLNTISFLVEALSSEVWVLFFSAILLQLLWLNLGTAAMSAISKLVERTELGKLMALLALVNALVTVAAKPFFAFVYQATLSTIPACVLYIAMALFMLDVLLVLYLHVRMKTVERTAPEVAVEL